MPITKQNHNIDLKGMPASNSPFAGEAKGRSLPDSRPPSDFEEKLRAKAKRQRRLRFIVVLSVLLLLVLIAAGAAVAVIIVKRNNAPKGGSSSPFDNVDDGTSVATGGGKGTPTRGDPSVFEKNPKLHRSLYGLAYTPEGSLPDYGCNIRLANVIKDVQLMSQLTRRIRIYGGDCNQTAVVLEAIKQTKVDLEVFLGNYVVAGDSSAYERQKKAIKEAIEVYGVTNIAGITVGNEYILNYVTEHNATSPNDEIANTGAQALLANIRDTRQMLASMNLPKTIPVGNSDAGSYFNDQVLSAVDYGLSNVHAWFAKVPASEGAAWVNQFFKRENVDHAATLPNKPKMYIAETGWPTDSADAEHMTSGRARADVASLQTFLDTFVCDANANGVGYFFFEFSNEEWKRAKYGGIEGEWGLFYSNRTLKAVTIPNCLSP